MRLRRKRERWRSVGLGALQLVDRQGRARAVLAYYDMPWGHRWEAFTGRFTLQLHARRRNVETLTTVRIVDPPLDRR